MDLSTRNRTSWRSDSASRSDCDEGNSAEVSARAEISAANQGFHTEAIVLDRHCKTIREWSITRGNGVAYEAHIPYVGITLLVLFLSGCAARVNKMMTTWEGQHF